MSLRKNESGMAAILITMILMVVISLTVLGFATISRRERRQSLDQQLSTQAFYAAESGINDATQAIQTALASGTALSALTKTDCALTGSGPYASLVSALSANVSYTCVLVNTSPGSLVYKDVNDSPIVARLQTSSGDMSQLEVNWRPSSPSAGVPTSDCPSSTTNVFTPGNSWNCGYGVLRLDLVDASAGLGRAALQNNQRTFFFVPNPASGSTTVAYPASNRPVLVSSSCTSGSYGSCSVRITGINTDYAYAKISSLYAQSAVTLTGLDSGAARMQLVGAQMIVDVTGKAEDVLRRVQVRVPITGTGIVPSAAIQTNDSLCKRFRTAPNYFEIPNDITDYDSSDPMCRPVTRP